MLINLGVSNTYVQRMVGTKGWTGVMEHAGFKAQLMKAPRLKGTGIHQLPLGEPLPVFPIATLPSAPKDWVREAGTYVCPVSSEIGLWFNWTMNDELNTAVVCSIKGMNPITGCKLEGFALESYVDKCPTHNESFAHGRFCLKCGYEWPPQNYITYDSGQIWWDGFRQSDGTIRQFFFTEDEARDIALLVIGKESTVPAFGFAFYTPKNPRVMPKVEHRYSYSYPSLYYGSNKVISAKNMKGFSTGSGDNGFTWTDTSTEITFNSQVAPTASYNASGILRNCNSVSEDSNRVEIQSLASQEVKEVSIGAGAQINQKLEKDSLGIDGWKDKPDGIIRLYFCFMPQFRQIVKDGGIKELTGNREGYLKGLPVG